MQWTANKTLHAVESRPHLKPSITPTAASKDEKRKVLAGPCLSLASDQLVLASTGSQGIVGLALKRTPTSQLQRSSAHEELGVFDRPIERAA